MYSLLLILAIFFGVVLVLMGYWYGKPSRKDTAVLQNWGKTQSFKPILHIMPSSLENLLVTVQDTANKRLKIKAIG